MKHRGFAVYAAAAISLLAIIVLAGCGGGGGSLNSNVTSPWNGSLSGVATEPNDGETNIATSRIDSWIHVYWPDANFPPPPEFTVSVEKEETPGNWGGIHTRLSVSQSDPNGGSWWFQPGSDFSPHANYRIIIQASGETSVINYFQTGSSLSMSAGPSARSTSGVVKTHRPALAGDATGEDSVTHTIKVAK